MEPLVTDQRILTWLCVLPVKENASRREKYARIAFTSAVIVIAILNPISTISFIVKFFSIDFVGTTIALCQLSGCISMINSTVAVFFLRHKIPSIYEKLSPIYEKFKNDDSFRYLVDVNKTSEWLWNMYIKYVLGGFFVLILISALGSAAVCWLSNGYFDVTKMFIACRFLLPWDQSTFVGFIGEIIFDEIASINYLMYNGVILLTFISICLHHQAFFKMFRNSFRKFNHSDGFENNRKFICDMINFHTSIKSWFLETADIYSPHIMVQIICNMLILTALIFQLDQQIFIHFNISVGIFTAMGCSTVLSNLFLCCYLGKMASNSYAQMAECLYDCNWYEIPLDLQKYFIIMVANSQVPPTYSGYGVAELNLSTFRKILRTVHSYYMMFKAISSIQ